MWSLATSKYNKRMHTISLPTNLLDVSVEHDFRHAKGNENQEADISNLKS